MTSVLAGLRLGILVNGRVACRVRPNLGKGMGILYKRLGIVYAIEHYNRKRTRGVWLFEFL